MAEKKDRADLLDALKAEQKANGFISEEIIRQLAQEYGLFPSQVYETATFYSMLHVIKAPKHIIEICGSTCCDAARSDELIREMEAILGVKCTEINEDGWMLRRCECLGRCDSAPNALVDGVLVCNATKEMLCTCINKAGE